MTFIMSACAIMHNMIVVERKDHYSRNGAGGYWHNLFAAALSAEDVLASSLQPLSAADQVDVMKRFERSAVAEETKSKAQHARLKAALVRHISEPTFQH
jgi:hypothetical protein